MLDVPDSDAIAVVADDDKLSTRVFDVYSLNSPAQMAAPLSLSEALDVYFEDIVHPIELPNFRAVLALPSNDQLESVLERDARAALERIRGSRARIEEKVTAIGLIGPEDSRRLVDILLHTMRTGQPSLSLLISEEADNND
jgi:AcrR family transcriptional regulator